ncbi:HET-domain-containing protein [Melanomma pulvis-pyrius CBS 109.77]|uniref:HET-domain-containing protein n=1 Tax=Melanomma pulvis-pyrius CBS 109.77 TaxID=1314802 RepID=A0A6A6X6M0_9PLEO|nr:HET-domain-containing protein [Melanomma pulvis-pyrius CBS 109.77]
MPENSNRKSNELWPRRLIHVGDELTNPRLVETSDLGEHQQPRYTTLSHCWGTSGIPDGGKTTAETIDKRASGIDLETLPRTFRDAIDVTRRLGFQYLWIDALCLIQGSKTDWEEEGEKMGAIYSNSTITLAAESSIDSQCGLFTNNVGPDEDLDSPTPVTNVLSDGRESTLIFRSSDSRSLKTSNAHLQTRAWALQERVLSPRILHFFDVGILWECRHHYEIWHEPSANILMEQYGYATLDELEQVRKIITDHPFDLPRWVLYRPWFRLIVPEYTSRKLTFRSDTLPAISSIARALQKQTNSTYLAGLFAEDIAFGLTWHPVTRKARGEVIEAQVIGKPRPSWSWASYDTPCACTDIRTSPLKSRITLQSHQIDLAGSDPYGQVLGGRLHIRGRVLQGRHVPGDHHYAGEVSLYLRRDGTVKSRHWNSLPGQSSLFESDAAIEDNTSEIITGTVCLLLCSAEGLDYFLALNKVEEPNVFERQSMFFCRLSTNGVGESNEEWMDWLEYGDEEDIVLI